MVMEHNVAARARSRLPPSLSICKERERDGEFKRGKSNSKYIVNKMKETPSPFPFLWQYFFYFSVLPLPLDSSHPPTPISDYTQATLLILMWYQKSVTMTNQTRTPYP